MNCFVKGRDLQPFENSSCMRFVKGHDFSRAVIASQSTAGFSRWGMFFTASASKLLFSANCSAVPQEAQRLRALGPESSCQEVQRVHVTSSRAQRTSKDTL